MIKRVIEQIFQDHAAESLRKTLAEVERAASGKLHNESLADYVTRLASFKYDAEHRMEQLADYAALTDEWHSVSLENGREPDELMGDYMVRIWNGMNVAQRFAEDQKEKLEKAQKEWQERDAAQSKSFNRRLDELAEEAIKQKVRADDIQRELAKSISLSNERAQEISKLRGTHADDIARIDKLSAQLAEIESEATECGRNEGETVPNFMSRLVINLGDERASSMAMSKAWAESKEDVAREHERGNRINSEYEASIATIMAAANKLGRADYESPDAFMQRQSSEIARLRSRLSEEINDAYKCAGTLGRLSTETVTDFMKRQHAEIEKEQQRNVQMSERLSLVMQDYQDKSQQLLNVQGWHEENLQKIRELEACNASLRSDIRTEMSKIAKQLVNPEGTNGLVIDFVREITADRDRIRAELAAILAEANKSGRCNGDPVQLLKAGQSDLDARLSAEREAEDIKKRWRSLNEHAALKGMRGDETTAEFITRQHRLAADRQTALDRASETITTLTSDLTSAIVDKALAGNGAKEINRLSALVADLQVELDEARSKFGGIMAQLGNETPLQLIERMQRLAQDQRASTIPHDERAMLVAEIADLRKRLEESQKAHAKAEHELTDARNGANECGMQAGERLRAFIYRKRAELLDALHASDRIQLLANENVDKLRAALATVASQSAAITEAHRVTEQCTSAVEALAKLKDWASTIRHKVLVAMVHTKAMEEYDNIMKELDGKAGTDGR